jgi:hypothetical protein
MKRGHGGMLREEGVERTDQAPEAGPRRVKRAAEVRMIP